MINNQLFHYFFYNSPNAFFFTRPDGSIINANNAAVNIFNYTIDELIKKGRDGLFSIDHLQDALNKRMEDGSIRMEGRGIKKEGTQFPVEIFSWLIKGEDGNTYGANLIVDISQRTEQGNHLEMIYLLSKDMIGIVQDLHFITINPAGTTILGYDEEELLSFKIEDLIHPDDLHKSKEERDKILKGQHSEFFINRYKCKDGAYKSLEWNITKKDEKVYFIARDVSTIIKEEEHYRLLESVVANSKDGVIITEPYPFDFPGPRIIFVNDTIINNTGYSREELIGSSPRMFQGRKTDRKELSKLKEALKKSEACEIEVINYKKNGEEFWVNISVFPLFDNKGSLTNFVSFQKNITNRKNIEEALANSNRINLFTSRINELILKATSKEEIYNKIPEIAVNVGEFEFVWFTKPNVETGIIETISYAGNECGYIDYIVSMMSKQDTPFGKGPTGNAFRNKKYYYSNDIINQTNMITVREEAVIRGFKSCMALPVIINDEVKYIINFYSTQLNYFNHHEIKLLENLSDNIAFAFNALYNKNKREETELNLAKLNMAIEQSSSTVVITNLTGEIEYINSAGCKLTGYNKEELIGENSRILKTGNTSKEEYEQLWNRLKAGKTWQGTFCNKKKNGELYWEAAVISPVINTAGITTNYIAVKEDITKKRAMEEEQKLLTDILRNSNAAIVISDMNDHIIFLNDIGRKIMSFSLSDDISAYTLNDFLTDKSKLIVQNIARPSLIEKDSWEGEVDVVTREGRIIPAFVISMLHRNQKGEPDLKSSTLIDITDRKRSEGELIKLNEELKSLTNHLYVVKEEERKVIAKDIHDELGQSLTLIKLDISWVLSHIDDDKSSLVKKLEQLKNTTNETVQTSRRLYNAIYPQMLDDIGLIGTIKWHSKSYLENQNIAIKIHCNIDTEKITPDHTICLTLFRVYQETFTNILRYSKANKVSIEVNIEDNNILMNIEDNGIGFEVNKVDTKLHHGLLGMRERVQALNGTILIESVLGKGTKTMVRVPLA